MDKVKSMKILPWTKKDWILNLVVFIANFLVFIGLFFLSNYITKADFLIKWENFFNFIFPLLIVFATIFVYNYYEDRNFLKNAANSEIIFLIMEISFIACFFFGERVSPYIRPFAAASLLTSFLINRRTATFTGTMFSLIVFLFDTFTGIVAESQIVPSAFFLVAGISSSIVATYTMRNIYSRIELLVLSIIISLPVLLCVIVALVLMGINGMIEILVYAFISGPLSAAVCLIILPILEIIFKKVTCFKYSELTSHKSKLLKRMIEETPGTFNHSLVVANLTEACATAIGEDPLLARVCAYYHDIGKLRHPEMFKENQTDENPHDDLTPELSANIIKAHTDDGYKLCKKNRLPKELADVCKQHHGTMPILYFYDKAKKFTDGEVDIAEYCYSGPKPQTKIAVIVMLADSVEAAVRTLKDRSTENVQKTAGKILNERMKLGQFEECEITLKEISIIIDTIVSNLTGVYHKRIAYPKVSLDGIELPEAEAEE